MGLPRLRRRLLGLSWFFAQADVLGGESRVRDRVVLLLALVCEGRATGAALAIDRLGWRPEEVEVRIPMVIEHPISRHHHCIGVPEAQNSRTEIVDTVEHVEPENEVFRAHSVCHGCRF